MPIFEFKSKHDIIGPTPVRIQADGPLSEGHWQLQPEQSGPALPAQRDGGDLVVLLRDLPAGVPVRYSLVPAGEVSKVVRVQPSDSGLDLVLPQGRFSTYHYAPEYPRPFLWPVLGPTQKEMTRAFPMETREEETQDHKHHRSLWTAYEEVNGACNWHEQEGHGFTRHQSLVAQEEGPVFGGFTAQSIWTDSTGKPVLEETRKVRLYNAGEDVRLLDYEVVLAATHGDLEFGETKEAGIISIRVASSMDGKCGGLITNSEGGRGEAECWGKKAAWCDYSGDVEGERMGITIFDHPSNPNFPTRWHVRDYGLFATNPFSTASFNAGEPSIFRVPAGESIRFQYRVLIHSGEARTAEITGAYDAFAHPTTTGQSA